MGLATGQTRIERRVRKWVSLVMDISLLIKILNGLMEVVGIIKEIAIGVIVFMAQKHLLSLGQKIWEWD